MRSCCIWLVDSFQCMMMHGLANPKVPYLFVFLIKTHYKNVLKTVSILLEWKNGPI